VRSLSASCRHRTKQRHNAQCPGFEVRISYPFHPRSGETVTVLGSKRHAGAEHFVIRQPDRTLALLPGWMTEPGQAALQIVVDPRFPVQRLADLRVLVDALMASCTGDSPPCKGAGDAERTTQTGGSVRRGTGHGTAARTAKQADATPSDATGRGRPTGATANPARRSRQCGRR
jgi:Family of unknown function (DUF5372)